MNRIADLTGGRTDFESIRFEQKGQVVTVVIDRPRTRNSFCLRLFEEIQEAFRTIDRDDSIGVVVFTGSGDVSFCSGADLNEHWSLCQRPRDYAKWIREFITMQTAIMRCGKPTIARLNGLVLGGGNELHLACDLSVAADDVIIRQVEPQRGSVSGIGVTQWLALAVGDRRARQAIMLGEDITATQAYEWGLINKVVPRSELDAAVEAMAVRLLATFPESLRYAKTQMNYWKESSWAATVPHAGEWLALHSGSPETHEGMRSFFEKRSPDHALLRERAVSDRSPEFAGGSPIGTCGQCGAANLPSSHAFCGVCGARR